ncbi:MAG: dicarboxylate/amino acid:cation symporter, partial [Candidatus Electrothrix sp. EH2]|nr:dicarboxylate/amino acid:cation symporter [Candidatus Electrothrix sp. EH2]
MQKKKNQLTLYILGAIVIAVVFALVFPHAAMKFHIGGEVFLNLLKMMVVPLVVSSVMNGILGLGDIRKLGRPGGAALLYYFSTTLMAVLVGLVVVNIIQPGNGTVDQQ